MLELVVWFGAATGLLIVILLLVITWAIWRMTQAHERIEQHVSEVERQFAAYLQSRPRA